MWDTCYKAAVRLDVKQYAHETATRESCVVHY